MAMLVEISNWRCRGAVDKDTLLPQARRWTEISEPNEYMQPEKTGHGYGLRVKVASMHID